MLFNRTRPLIGFEIPTDNNPIWSALGNDPDGYLNDALRKIISLKYADLNYAMDVCESDMVRQILRHAPIENRHERVLVDIKVHDLKKGQHTCVPGWHLDGSIDPDGIKTKGEVHHLFVASRFCRTLFLDSPLDIPVDPSWTFAERSKKIGALLDDMILSVFTIPNCRFVTYDDTFFHRGAQSEGDELRLLIRVTETDVIKPQNRVYTPYTHP